MGCSDGHPNHAGITKAGQASQSFDTKDEAVKWLLGLATALEAPSLPKTVRATRVPLRLGGAIPDTATIRS